MFDSTQAQTWDCGVTPGTVTATLDGGTLTISGTGAMIEYKDRKAAPWYGFRDSIAAVVIEVGITSVLGYAFCDCLRLMSVTLPDPESGEFFDPDTFDGSDKLPLMGFYFIGAETEKETKK
jgi:hypothetical protein